MKRIKNMKRFLICLFSFLFIGCSIAGGAVLLSNSSYSDNTGGGSSNDENNVEQNAPTNTDLWTASGNYATAFDNEGEAGIDGSTEEKAYEIRTAEQLALLAYRINTSSTNSTYKSLYYVQTADIDLSLHYWDAIGTDYSYQGLFGYIEGQSETSKAAIENVGIIDSYVQGYENVGGVVGTAESSGITNCYNTGSVDGSRYIGGVVGYAGYNTSVGTCYNTGNVTGGSYVGGVVGYANDLTVTNCYNTGSVTGSEDNVGGVVGQALSYVTITNCYNTGSVEGSSDVGGVVGEADYNSTITNCYNTGSVDSTYVGYVGGVVGYAFGSTTTFTNCYYGGNCTLSYGIGDPSSNTGASKDSNLIANAKRLSWYQDTSKWSSEYPWDFVEVWSLVPSANDGYPILQGFSVNISYNSNYGENEVITEQVPSGQEIVIEGYNLFTRVGYEIAHWNTSPTGSGVNYYAGNVYAGGANLTLYAQWEPAVYRIELNANDGAGGLSAMYVKYNTGFYSNSTATAGLSSLSDSNLPTRAGYTLLGFYTANSTSSTCLISVTTNSSGVRTGTFTDAFTTTYFTGPATLYAQWEANNPAYYDEAGGYWYIENGRMPQTRVDDPALIDALDENWDTLEEHSRFFIPSYGSTFRSKIYNGGEYCRANGNFYIVEPIRWRLTSNPNQEVGYGTTDDTYAILNTIVYAGRYSTEELGAGNGYQNVAVTIFDDNQISTTYLVTETKSMPTFGTGSNLYGEPQDVTDNIFVSSREEIMSVAGTYEIEFSDLIYDFITNVRGSIPLYYTRDLGTNYNHIICLTEDGEVVQRQPDQIYNQLGVQFTIKFSEYACVER